MIVHLVAWLLADATLAAGIGTRLRPGMLQQGETLPAATYAQISRVAPHDRGGADGLAYTRWQFDVHARTYEQATTLANALVARAQTFTRASSPRVSRVFVDAVRDLDTADYDELAYYRKVIDVEVIAGEP